MQDCCGAEQTTNTFGNIIKVITDNATIEYAMTVILAVGLALGIYISLKHRLH